MKKITLFACLLIGIAQSNNLYAQGAPAVPSTSAHTINDLQIGDVAPSTEVTLKNATGKVTSLKQQFSDKGLLVMFSCNTCPYVIRSQARTKEVIGYAKQHGLGVVVINSNEGQRSEADSYDAMVKYAKEQGYDVPYLMDDNSALADMFGATHTPEVYIFNGGRRLIYRGAMEDNPTDPVNSKQMYAKNAIDRMAMNQPAVPARTKSIGCSIKRI